MQLDEMLEKISEYKHEIQKAKKQQRNEIQYERRLATQHFCECCQINIDRYYCKKHNESAKHKRNLIAQ
jgi:hypothetical protein